MAITGKGLAIAAAINVLVLMVVFIVFNFMRIWAVTRKFYSARR